MRTLDSWFAYGDFRLLWFANFCAFTGQWLQLLSIGWLVKELSAGSAVGGLLVLSASALNTLPGLVVNPLTGVLGDRLDRRKLAIVVQAIAAALALGLRSWWIRTTSGPGMPTPTSSSPDAAWPSPNRYSR